MLIFIVTFINHTFFIFILSNICYEFLLLNDSFIILFCEKKCFQYFYVTINSFCFIINIAAVVQIMFCETTGSRRHFTLKSQLILVHMYFALAQYQIKIDCFSFMFPTYVLFCRKIVVPFFKPFHRPNVLTHLEKSSHILNNSLSTVFQVTNNQSTSTIDRSFNLYQT